MKKLIMTFCITLIAGIMAFSLTSCKKDKTCEEDPNQEKCQQVEKTCEEDPNQEKCQTEEIVKCTDTNQDYRLILKGYAKGIPLSHFFAPVEEDRDIELVIEGDENYVSYKDGEYEYIYDKHDYDIYQILNDEKILIIDSDIPLNEKQVTLFALTRFGICSTIVLRYFYLVKEQTITEILNYEIEQEGGHYEGFSTVFTTFLTDIITGRVLKVDLYYGEGTVLSCEATRYESIEIDNSRYNNLKNGTPDVEIKINKLEWYDESFKEEFNISGVVFPEEAKITMNKVEMGKTRLNIDDFYQYTISGTLEDGSDTFKKISELIYEQGYQYIMPSITHKPFDELCIDYSTSITFTGHTVDNVTAQVVYWTSTNAFRVCFYIEIPNN